LEARRLEGYTALRLEDNTNSDFGRYSKQKTSLILAAIDIYTAFHNNVPNYGIAA
jgi:hypothetical protein